ncbi:MAG TPA: hypothetical protein VGK50_00235 [Coriobacteriia bacterium]
MNRKIRRRLALIAILAVLLSALGLWFWNYQATKQLGFNLVAPAGDRLNAPTYFYAFSGTQANHLQQPIGVLVVGDQVYVADAKLGEVFVFGLQGQYVKRFGKGTLLNPLYMARNPVSGNLYISDRGKRQMFIYSLDGKYLGVFDPKLPKNELPKFDTHGFQWIPIAFAFAPDGRLYAADILNGHRLLLFGRDGKFVKSVGTAGLAVKADSAPTAFQFPNSIKVHGKEVWVVDSNNRRIQIFDLNGNYLRLIPTSGLPRGLAFLPPQGSRTGTGTIDAAVVVDTLSHDATIWSAKGENILNFGEQGTADGQFNFPADVSIGPKSLIFITDTNNIRVQVWGWPEKVSVIPPIQLPQNWGWCFSPLLLLPLLLLRRKRRFMVTDDFVDGLITVEKLPVMPARRRYWVTTDDYYERLKDIDEQGVNLGELLHPSEYSESDAKALMDKFEIGHETAVVLAMAQRAKVFCTNDAELRRLAKLLELDVLNQDEFLDRYDKLPSSVTEE